MPMNDKTTKVINTARLKRRSLMAAAGAGTVAAIDGSSMPVRRQII
jgi:hypothetical protein